MQRLAWSKAANRPSTTGQPKPPARGAGQSSRSCLSAPLGRLCHVAGTILLTCLPKLRAHSWQGAYHLANHSQMGPEIFGCWKFQKGILGGSGLTPKPFGHPEKPIFDRFKNQTFRVMSGFRFGVRTIRFTLKCYIRLLKSCQVFCFLFYVPSSDYLHSDSMVKSCSPFFFWVKRFIFHRAETTCPDSPSCRMELLTLRLCCTSWLFL